MLRIDKVQDGQNTVLRLSGRVQVEDLSVLRQQLEQLDDNFVLDLSEIQLVDESVVRFLTECHRRLDPRDAKRAKLEDFRVLRLASWVSGVRKSLPGFALLRVKMPRA